MPALSQGKRGMIGSQVLWIIISAHGEISSLRMNMYAHNWPHVRRPNRLRIQIVQGNLLA